jgi:hypothetical protein
MNINKYTIMYTMMRSQWACIAGIVVVVVVVDDHLHTRQSRERACRLDSKNEIYRRRDRSRRHPENRIPQLMTSDLPKLDGP